MNKQYELLHLSKSIGLFIEYWGFKEIHGKIWTYIYLKDRPVSSKELKEVFGISKALLSPSIKELKKYDVIREAGKGEFGAELFTSNPSVFDAIINVLREREKVIISKIKSDLNNLKTCTEVQKKEMEISSKRLKNLNELVNTGQKALNGIIRLDDLSLGQWKKFHKAD